MITISKKVEYSVVLISYLATKKGELVSLKDISKRLMLPYRFLGQLANELKVAGLLESKEGKLGGYHLSKGWENKSVFDLLEALGENKHVVKCLGDDECKRLARCGMRSMWSKLETTVVNELKKIKLNEATNH